MSDETPVTYSVDPFAYDDEAGRYQCLRCEQWSDEDDDTIEHLEDCPVGQPMLAGSEQLGLLARADYFLTNAPESVSIEDGIVLDLVKDLAATLRPLAPEPTAPTRPTREQVRELMAKVMDPIDFDIETVAEATDAVMALIGGDDA